MKSSKRDLSMASRTQNETKKRPKTQSNTLLNYFETNKKVTVSPEVKQSSILGFIKRETKSDEIKSEAGLDSVKIESDKSAFNLLMQKQVKKEDQVEEKTQVSEAKKQPERKCPFYKRIEGTKIAVDAFSYGDIENCDAYFLSHYHYDHFIGLNKYFKNKLFCSKITANLVIKQIKVDKKYIVALELDKFVNVYDFDDSIQVTCIDANQYEFQIEQKNY